MSITFKLVEKGGPGSGHHGHRGRPGKRGGSLPGGSAAGGKKPKASSDGGGSGKKYEPLSDSQKKKFQKILPGGKGRSGYSWSKRGGHAGKNSVAKAVEKAKAMGFEKTDVSAISSQFGAMGGGVVYQHPETGVVLRTSESYGVTSYHNWFRVSLHFPGED